MITITRYHDISCGHRVVGHEGKCIHLHGHNYRVYFTVSAVSGVDELGRVIDFSVIKDRLCMWLENHWDHRMLVWKRDPHASALHVIDAEGVYFLDFNPTAENMAEHLVKYVGPDVLTGTSVQLISVRIEETRKCSATYTLDIEPPYTME